VSLVAWKVPANKPNHLPPHAHKCHCLNSFSTTWPVRGLLEKYPTFGREKETGLPGALDT